MLRVTPAESTYNGKLLNGENDDNDTGRGVNDLRPELPAFDFRCRERAVGSVPCPCGGPVGNALRLVQQPLRPVTLHFLTAMRNGLLELQGGHPADGDWPAFGPGQSVNKRSLWLWLCLHACSDEQQNSRGKASIESAQARALCRFSAQRSCA